MRIKEFLKSDIFYVFVVCLLIGLILGFCCPKQIYKEFQIKMQELYLKTHPDSQKDSKTIIIEKATKNIDFVPQTSIFDEPVKKENGFVLFIKKIFVKQEPKKEMTINDEVIDY